MLYPDPKPMSRTLLLVAAVARLAVARPAVTRPAVTAAGCPWDSSTGGTGADPPYTQERTLRGNSRERSGQRARREKRSRRTRGQQRAASGNSRGAATPPPTSCSSGSGSAAATRGVAAAARTRVFPKDNLGVSVGEGKARWILRHGVLEQSDDQHDEFHVDEALVLWTAQA